MQRRVCRHRRRGRGNLSRRITAGQEPGTAKKQKGPPTKRAALFVVPLVTRPNLGPFAGTKDNTKTDQRTAAGGAFYRLCCVRRAAWRRPLDVTDLGAFGPKVLLLPSSAQNTPPGCICGVLDYKASAFYFLFLSLELSSEVQQKGEVDFKGSSKGQRFSGAEV